MDAQQAQHPTSRTLHAYGLGRLDDAAAEAVNAHLDGCPACRRQVAALSSDSFVRRLREARARPDTVLPVFSATGSPEVKWAAPGPPPLPGNARPPGPPPRPASILSATSISPPSPADHPDYEIKDELGRGGMGVVYLAHNRLMGRDEVLKVVRPEIMERPRLLDRFLREIRAVAKLRHPNIVTAYHPARVGESIVLAMEYVEGLDLARLVEGQGPLPVADACRFAYQAALGLQHAHEEGLVHRDIKPGNLMLACTGDKATVKVLDFGLAKATREQKADGALTSAGQALGTPDFIAPEQILDATSADIRADIYSLGGTLYYLLAGRPPFERDSLYDTFQAHISQEALPLNLVRPDVPPELAALVAKMMAKEPARRFQTPADVARALTPFFKHADAAFEGPKGYASQDSPSIVDQEGMRAVSTPAQSAMVPSVPPVRAETVVETIPPVAPWDSLIGLRKATGSLIAKPSLAKAIRRIPPWVWPTVAAAALFGSILLGVIIITIRGKNGETRITVNDDQSFKVEGPGFAVEHKPPGDPRASPTAAIDLLSMIDVRRHTTRGHWQRLNSSLLAVAGEYDEIRVPYEPPDAYRLDITAVRIAGRNDLQVGMYFPDGQCFIILDGWGGTTSGINGVNGKLANENVTTYHGSVFKDGVPCHLVVTVRKHRIEVTADGRSIIDWRGRESRLTLRNQQGPHVGPLGLHVMNPGIRGRALSLAVQHPAGYRIDRFTLTPLSEPRQDKP